MFADHNGAVYELLKAARLFEVSQLKDLQATHEATGKPLGEVVIDSGLVTRREFLGAVAGYLGVEYVESIPPVIEASTRQAVSPKLAHRYGVAPYRRERNRLKLLVSDPFNHQVIDDLSFSLHCDIEPLLADPDQVLALIDSVYGPEDESISEILAEISPGDIELGDEADEETLASVAGDAPIIRLVDLILTQAIRDQASDIHFEPYEDTFRIRYRIDGALYEMAPPPKNLAVPITSRIKVLADLNIAERRVPQDGRIKMTIAGRPVDLRVSTLPTQFGESVVLRVLDKSVVNLELDQLGIPDEILSNIRNVAKRPNGIFIVTGPTGSGKTTTLYSALREVNVEDTKILTAEDPVEYEIEGIMQVAINPQVGLTFAKALRSFLRQDPDKILVGEIRDLETAQIAVQASLTGHLVMSTLHTNDATGAVTRLVDMGLEPYLIAASLEAVLAQRLVRRICRHCISGYVPDAGVLEALGLSLQDVNDRRFHFGRGCPECHQTGYQGRFGLFEMIMVGDRLRELITQRTPGPRLRSAAMEQGMRTLREDGIRAVFDGKSTVEEVLKYT